MPALINQTKQLAHRKFMEAFCPFFRVYRYEGNLPINRADARGAVFFRSKLFYNRIPKNANTTIVSVIRQLEERVLDQSRLKKGMVRPSQLWARDVEQLEATFFKFVFTRNPFTRVLSAYRDKISGGRRQAAKFNRWAKRKGLGSEPCFANFCSYLGEAGLYEDPHWAPQVDCLLIQVSKFDFIGSIENLETDLPAMLSRALRDEFKVDIPRRNATNSSASVREYYSAREIDIVKELYKSDFEVFGYPEAFPPG